MSATSEVIRVVIADDSVVIRRQFEKLCADVEGIEVVGSAVNGRDAIEQVRRLSPDLLVMDIVMPEMDGLEAITRLREEGLPTRVVILSSLGGSDDRANQAFDLGASEVLSKPLDQESIARLVATELMVRKLG